MAIFRRLVFTAVLAGVGAGLVATLFHQRFTVPLIVQAESFETAAAPHGTAEAWHPHSARERALATGVSDVLTGIAYALLLVAVWEWRGVIPQWPQGIGWGVGGFLVFTVAPSLGLPAELPGAVEAALPLRQAWWVGTVVVSGVGLGLACFGRRAVWRLLGLGALVLPHVIGAPLPPGQVSPVPGELTYVFRLAVYLCSFHFWLALGLFASLVYGRRQGQRAG